MYSLFPVLCTVSFFLNEMNPFVLFIFPSSFYIESTTIRYLSSSGRVDFTS